MDRLHPYTLLNKKTCYKAVLSQQRISSAYTYTYLGVVLNSLLKEHVASLRAP